MVNGSTKKIKLAAGTCQLARGEPGARRLVRRLMHRADKEPAQAQRGFMRVAPNTVAHFL